MDNLTLLMFIAPIVFFLLLPVSAIIKTILIVLFLFAMLYFKRGYYYIIRGTHLINNYPSEYERGWIFYEKGLKCGVSNGTALAVANLFLQRNDAEIAHKVYNSIIKKKEGKSSKDALILNNAKIGKAEALWIFGEREKAVELLYKLYNKNIPDRNIGTILSGYLLKLDRLEEAQHIIDDAFKNRSETVKMVDNRGYYYYLKGFLKDSETLYDKLLENRAVKSPETLYHASLVAISLGDDDKGKNYLTEALKLPFYKTYDVTKEEIEELLNQANSNLDDNLVFDFYDTDMFEDEAQSVDRDYEEIELNSLLDPDDYYYDEEEEMEIDEDEYSLFESTLLDEYEDDYEELSN